MKLFIVLCGILYLKSSKADISCLQNEICVNSKVLQGLNANILNTTDACDNLWLYACGSWTPNMLENNMDTFTTLGNKYASKLQNLMKNESFQRDSILLQKIRAYLSACEAAQETSISYYMRELPEITSNWLLEIAKFRQLGLNDIFLHESVDVVSFDATLQVVSISMPSIEQSFESKQQILSYLQQVYKDADLNLAKDVFALELSLKTLQSKQLKKTSPERLLNLAELKSHLPIIDWQLYFDKLLEQRAPDQLLIRINDVDYIREMSDLLNSTSSTIKQAYMLARLSRYIEDVRPHTVPFACLKHMLVTWPLGLDYIYDRYLYNTRHKDELILGNMLGNLKAQFAVNLGQVPLSSKQRNFIENKLQFMRLKIGNLPAANMEYFENFYAETLINSSNFYQNHWEMLRFRTLLQHRPLLLGIQQSRVSLAEYVVNDDIMQARDAPYYVHNRNLLIVPFVFLQLPFYQHLLHPLFQYSLVGWMLAHELQHAFDPNGILLNAQGVESRVGDSILNTVHYQTSIDCLIAQLPAPVNLAERMADVNGLQLAFQTYFERVAKNTQLISSEYSTKQLFFLNMAQLFCGSLPEPLHHDRDDVRVIIGAANLPEFAAAFQCQKGSREYPTDRCHMWN